MNHKIAFVFGLFLQLLALHSMLMPHALLLANGQSLRLETLALDPNRLPEERSRVIPVHYRIGANPPPNVEPGTILYVLLQQVGDRVERIRVTYDQPTVQPGQACLRGRLEKHQIVFPDISRLHVSQYGLESLFTATQPMPLSITIVSDESCRATVQAIHVPTVLP